MEGTAAGGLAEAEPLKARYLRRALRALRQMDRLLGTKAKDLPLHEAMDWIEAAMK